MSRLLHLNPQETTPAPSPRRLPSRTTGHRHPPRTTPSPPPSAPPSLPPFSRRPNAQVARRQRRRSSPGLAPAAAPRQTLELARKPRYCVPARDCIHACYTVLHGVTALVALLISAPDAIRSTPSTTTERQFCRAGMFKLGSINFACSMHAG
jgi:hypothetical protein